MSPLFKSLTNSKKKSEKSIKKENFQRPKLKQDFHQKFFLQRF